MKLIDPSTGLLHLPNGIDVTGGMSRYEVERLNDALGFPPHLALGSSHPFGDSTLWWSLLEESGKIFAAHFYLIRNDLQGRYDWDAIAIGKQAHDDLLVGIFGVPPQDEKLCATWFERLFRKKGFREFVDTQHRLSWEFIWGTVSSHFDIRDYEPMVFMSWKS